MIKIIVIAVALAFAAPISFAKKKAPTAAGDVKKKKEEKPPPPNDKALNEGAQGRKNATEDAAKQVDAPWYDHRP